MLACKRAEIVLGQRGTCTASAVGGLYVQMNERPLRVGLRHLRRPGGAEVATNEGDESDYGSRPLASRLRHTGPDTFPRRTARDTRAGHCVTASVPP